MSIVENIYNRSPLFIQNMLISIYGLRLYYERYAGENKIYLKQLMQTQWMTEDNIKEYQFAATKNLLKHAYNNVPYYKDIFESCGFKPSKFKSLNDLKKLPLLQKETLRTAGNKIVANNISKHRMIGLNTSGTTGTSLRIMVDIESRRKSYAFFKRFHTWIGLKNSKHNVTFGGRVIIPLKNRSKIFWRYNAIMDNYLFSSYHMSDENLKCYVNKIRKVRPLWIEGYPSAIYTLAKYILGNNLRGINPRVITTSAETLMDYQKENIEKAFNCPVRDQYGCTEQALFISQCERGSYHIHPEYGIVEILNEDGEDVAPGEIGNIVCTSFVNKATPLIRYDLGDMASNGSGKCSCSRNFPMLRRIYGRKDDFIITPDGRKVGRLDPIFKGLTTIKEAQIIQEGLESIIIKIVPGKRYNNTDGEVLKKELRKRVGGKIKISIIKVDRISKSQSGKFKAVVSKVTR